MNVALGRVRQMPFIASVVLLIAGCGASSGSESTGPANANQFVEMLNAYSADYEPAGSPEELAAGSDVVVRGTLVDVVDGRYFGPSREDPGTVFTAVMSFDVVEVGSGVLPAGNDGRVYVEIIRSAMYAPEDLAAAAPDQLEAVLYLKAASELGESTVVGDVGAGLPAGQVLHVLTTPQGFVFSTGDDIVSAFAHGEPAFPGLESDSLDELLPKEGSNTETRPEGG